MIISAHVPPPAQDPGPAPGEQADGGTSGPGPAAGGVPASQALPSVPYDARHGNLAARWPALAGRLVRIGGAEVSFAAAVRAAEVLIASRTSAIAPVLRAASSPLAGCDYFAAAAPWLEQARELPRTGRAGAAGRHVTKWAFLAALSAVLDAARDAELSAWARALRTDERYAAAIARDAVAVRQRAHAAGIRSTLRAAVTRAIAACSARDGEFGCSESTACGTGACRFAQPPYRALTATAGPGRMIRPGNHAEAGAGFSESEAAAELAALVPWRDGVPVSDCRAR
jgi:hypothetical protein